MLTVILLQVIALVCAQLIPELAMVNRNSVFAGTMSHELIEELAEAAYSLWKADKKIPGKKKKKPVHSFMDYDDEIKKLDDMAIDAPAAMVMLNTVPATTSTKQPIFYKKHLKKRPHPQRPRVLPKVAHRKKFRPPPSDSYILPPDNFRIRKNPRWAVISQGRYRIRGKGRRIRQPVLRPRGR